MAFDIFLNIDGIPGEALDSKHKGEVQIESYSYSSKVGTVRANGTAAIVNDATFDALYSKASPKIFMACASGALIKKAVLSVRKQGKDQEDFLKITFDEVLVSSHQTQGRNHQKGPIPMETFSFNFSRIKFDYRVQQQTGILSGTVSSSYTVQKEQGQGQ